MRFIISVQHASELCRHGANEPQAILLLDLLVQVCQDDHLMSGLAGGANRTAYRLQITREFCLRFRHQTKIGRDGRWPSRKRFEFLGATMPEAGPFREQDILRGLSAGARERGRATFC